MDKDFQEDAENSVIGWKTDFEVVRVRTEILDDELVLMSFSGNTRVSSDAIKRIYKEACSTINDIYAKGKGIPKNLKDLCGLPPEIGIDRFGEIVLSLLENEQDVTYKPGEGIVAIGRVGHLEFRVTGVYPAEAGFKGKDYNYLIPTKVEINVCGEVLDKTPQVDIDKTERYSGEVSTQKAVRYSSEKFRFRI